MYAVLLGLAISTASFTALAADPAPIARESVELRAHLERSCFKCHSGSGSPQVVKFGDFANASTLRRLVDTANPENSTIYKQVKPQPNSKLELVLPGAMPPEYLGESPLAPEARTDFLNAIVAWVQAGTPELSERAPVAEFDLETLYEKVFTDLVRLQQDEKANVRYVSFAHLKNSAAKNDLLPTYRRALFRLVNSLSWGVEIKIPEAIDKDNLIYRIRLSDYKWTAKNWKAMQSQYPYEADYLANLEKAQRARNITGDLLPIVRGDWFVKSAAQPPLYHEFLGIPATDKELEIMLGVNVADNINNRRALRAGFSSSGVSSNNRIIERHATGFGAYWKSYDFRASVGDGNIFANPVGPRTVKMPPYPIVNAFVPAGGEIIFNLPNKLQAYMLVDGAGKRIDKAPVEVVSDPSRPDRTVTNGISCMKCHESGIVPKRDEIAAYVKAARNDSYGQGAEFVKQFVSEMHGRQGELARLTQFDRDTFRDAIKLADGALAEADAGKLEPMSAAALDYEKQIAADEINAELGVSKEIEAVIRGASDLYTHAYNLFQQSEIAGLKRDLFEGAFQPAAIQIALNYGVLEKTLKEFLQIRFTGAAAGGGVPVLGTHRGSPAGGFVYDVPQGRLLDACDYAPGATFNVIGPTDRSEKPAMVPVVAVTLPQNGKLLDPCKIGQRGWIPEDKIFANPPAHPVNPPSNTNLSAGGFPKQGRIKFNMIVWSAPNVQTEKCRASINSLITFGPEIRRHNGFAVRSVTIHQTGYDDMLLGFQCAQGATGFTLGDLPPDQLTVTEAPPKPAPPGPPAVGFPKQGRLAETFMVFTDTGVKTVKCEIPKGSTVSIGSVVARTDGFAIRRVTVNRVHPQSSEDKGFLRCPSGASGFLIGDNFF